MTEPLPKWGGPWVGLIVVVGLTFTNLWAHVMAGPLAPDMLRSDLWSYAPLLGLILIPAMAYYILDKLGRGTHIGRALGWLIGAVLSGVSGSWVIAQYDTWVLDDIQVSQGELANAVHAYIQTHGEPPARLSMLIPAHIKVLPRTPEYCTHMALEARADRWALILDCNMTCEPRAAHDIVYDELDVRRVMYRSHTQQWGQCVLTERDCEAWSPEKRTRLLHDKR